VVYIKYSTGFPAGYVHIKTDRKKENMRKYFPELYFRRIEMENRTDEIERLLEKREGKRKALKWGAEWNFG